MNLYLALFLADSASPSTSARPAGILITVLLLGIAVFFLWPFHGSKEGNESPKPDGAKESWRVAFSKWRARRNPQTSNGGSSFWKIYFAIVFSGLSLILITKIPGCEIRVSTEFSSSKGVRKMKTDIYTETLIRGDKIHNPLNNKWE